MTLVILCSFHGFKVIEGFEYSIGDITLSNQKSVLKEKFLPSFIRKSIGIVRQKSLENPNLSFGYGEIQIDDINENLSTHLVHTALKLRGDLISFIDALWFIKNCSAHLNEFIFYNPEHELNWVVPINRIYTDQEGKDTLTVFSLEELDKCKDFMHKTELFLNPHDLPDFILNHLDTENNDGCIPSFLNHTSYNSFSRIGRALLFLDNARSSEFLAMKIAMYIPLLECLFSSGGTEVTHRVAERTALYIGRSADEKSKIYDLVTIAYDIRSKLLHGSALSQKAKGGINLSLPGSQLVICTELDNLIREVLTKVVLKDSEIFLDDTKHNSYFKTLLFS